MNFESINRSPFSILEEGNIHVPDSFNIPLLASFSVFPMFIMCTSPQFSHFPAISDISVQFLHLLMHFDGFEMWLLSAESSL